MWRENNPRNWSQGNNFNRMEISGAFGDLGTLIPFLLVYITIFKLNPVGVLFSFGLANIIIGWYYKTPIPVQPMKAIGTIAAANIGQITQGTIWGAGLFTGIIWLVLSITGAIKYIGKLVSKPVIKGILLGLGLSFMLEGLKMMNKEPVVALLGLLIVFFLQRNKRIPMMLVLIFFGFLVAILTNPKLLVELGGVRPTFGWPAFNIKPFTLHEFIQGALLLALPQLPLTIGNGVIALVAENNELFPKNSVSEQKIALSTSLINFFSPFLGGVPMCHGAGGMAGHVRFGAKTGGATITLGCLLLGLALFFGNSIFLLLQILPKAVLGIILFLAGTELSLSCFEPNMGRDSFKVLIITAGIAMWHTGIALIVGVLISHFTMGRSRVTSQ